MSHFFRVLLKCISEAGNLHFITLYKFLESKNCGIAPNQTLPSLKEYFQKSNPKMPIITLSQITTVANSDSLYFMLRTVLSACISSFNLHNNAEVPKG